LDNRCNNRVFRCCSNCSIFLYSCLSFKIKLMLMQFAQGHSPDPPRGRPVGGGGTYRSWGYGGEAPLLVFRKNRQTLYTPRFSGKSPIAREGFAKKSGKVAEDFLKTSIALLRIFKKVQCKYRQLSEKIGIASTSKTPGPPIFITVFRRSLVGLCRFSQKIPGSGAADFLKTAIALRRIFKKPVSRG